MDTADVSQRSAPGEPNVKRLASGTPMDKEAH